MSGNGIKEMRGGEYLLDGYITLDKPKVFKDENGIFYSIGIDWNTSRIDIGSMIENIYNHSLLSFYIFNQLFIF